MKAIGVKENHYTRFLLTSLLKLTGTSGMIKPLPIEWTASSTELSGKTSKAFMSEREKYFLSRSKAIS